MLQEITVSEHAFRPLLAEIPHCPICRGAHLEDWGNATGYSLYHCNTCSHRFADVRKHLAAPTRPDAFRAVITNGLMQSDLDFYRHLRGGEAPGQPTAVTTERLLTMCQEVGVRGGRWLDVGCGSGHLLELLLRRGWDAVGIEPGGWGQIAAEERGLHVVQGYLKRESFATPFDVVSATDVLEHQPDPYTFLTLLRHHVRTDGYVILSFPCADSLACRMSGPRWNMIAPPTHCQFFSRDSLQLLAAHAGLKVIMLRQHSVLHLKGASRYRIVRALVDAFFKFAGGGDQAVAVLRRETD